MTSTADRITIAAINPNAISATAFSPLFNPEGAPRPAGIGYTSAR
jgi:hypothetical protein